MLISTIHPPLFFCPKPFECSLVENYHYQIINVSVNTCPAKLQLQQIGEKLPQGKIERNKADFAINFVEAFPRLIFVRECKKVDEEIY